jgi:ABC-type proline/glycine betaine transport system ATPase subunit
MLSQAMVFQRPVMLRTTALANVIYGLRLKGHAARESEGLACAALARVGLEHLATGRRACSPAESSSAWRWPASGPWNPNC